MQLEEKISHSTQAGLDVLVWPTGTMRMPINTGEKKPLLLFGWMYERYESKCFWFEFTVLAEKTAIVLCASFIVEDPVLQVLIMLIIEFLSVLVALKTSAPVDSTAAVLLTASDGGKCNRTLMACLAHKLQPRSLCSSVVHSFDVAFCRPKFDAALAGYRRRHYVHDDPGLGVLQRGCLGKDPDVCAAIISSIVLGALC
ncbi:hypothetical protein DUNSADRAFT_6743 [Dunaliella salina]|uniref:Uncharacterized protein n=1 Tax=Dunaliella salina TaxID=3046 RepID=A0ABQ7H6K7_DUNSA|nr:hypothetical protein DUNSADRAFT_6743 [Dunaliella salina]|eukprot:KAF5842499.1 hypothetical protein DUNSADRAFT_6743 [Dunaliella salina]